MPAERAFRDRKRRNRTPARAHSWGTGSRKYFTRRQSNSRVHSSGFLTPLHRTHSPSAAAFSRMISSRYLQPWNSQRRNRQPPKIIAGSTTTAAFCIPKSRMWAKHSMQNEDRART